MINNEYIMKLKERVKVLDKEFKLLIGQDEIDSINQKLADRINVDYADKSPIFLITLKGAVFFAVDLLKRVEVDCEIDTIKAKSYGNEMHSSGKVEITNMTADIKGRHVIIVEDIIDTGLTIKALVAELQKHEPLSVETAGFLLKRDNLLCEVDVKYIGKEIPSDFVVGYGLDYAEKGRHFPAVYILD